ncbi:MAG: hypothetical protein LBV80_03335 [Deltaproteobacteria bacterium]|jgi:hypothetical protein|nr:hypothetical protein [Deltaproteobacteria bacterium]
MTERESRGAVKSPVEDLLVFSRRAVLAGINRALEQTPERPSGQASKRASGKVLEQPSGQSSEQTSKPTVLALDATAGNGVDTEFLARSVTSSGLVLAFDVQEEALRKTRERLDKSTPSLAGRVSLIRDSHENLDLYLAPYLAAGVRVSAAMYNLGFLPGGSSPLATLAGATLASLESLRPYIAPGAVLSIHCYAGHAQGAEESAAVEAWAVALPWREWRVLRYEFCNKPSNREILFIITNKL